MHAETHFVGDIDLHDPDLAARIRGEAERQGLQPRAFVADTIRRFMAAEDSESWTTIVGNIQRAEDPGVAFIATVMRKRLSHQCSH